MSDFTLFLRKFLRQGTAIASLAPSSRWLAQATIEGIDWSAARVVVELGAGTGPITRAIVERARPECAVLVLERDADFVKILRERFGHLPNVSVEQADVADLARLLEARGIGRVDHFVSGLPVPSFSRELQRRLFADVGRFLVPGGSYRQITELAWVYWRFYLRYFEAVRFRFEPRNFPPAGAYHCWRAKGVT